MEEVRPRILLHPTSILMTSIVENLALYYNGSKTCYPQNWQLGGMLGLVRHTTINFYFLKYSDMIIKGKLYTLFITVKRFSDDVTTVLFVVQQNAARKTSPRSFSPKFYEIFGTKLRGEVFLCKIRY